jgi:uncharacterized protein YdcH (DUF465 family)
VHSPVLVELNQFRHAGKCLLFLAGRVHYRACRSFVCKDLSMTIEKHSLVNDYPEFKDRIHELKMSNPHFAAKYEEYNELDKEIIDIEEKMVNTSDDYIEELKMKRVHLKDELVAMLRG